MRFKNGRKLKGKRKRRNRSRLRKEEDSKKKKRRLRRRNNIREQGNITIKGDEGSNYVEEGIQEPENEEEKSYIGLKDKNREAIRDDYLSDVEEPNDDYLEEVTPEKIGVLGKANSFFKQVKDMSRKNFKRKAAIYTTVISFITSSFFFLFILLPMALFIVVFGSFYIVYEGDELGSNKAVAQDKNKEETTKESSDDSVGGNLSKGTVWPVPHTKNITSGFGPRKHPVTGEVGKSHNGIDIAGVGGYGANINKDIVAFAKGKVVRADPESKTGGFGNLVVIQHGENYQTFYAHLNKINTSVGKTVKAGDVIGGMGTTGRSTGVHLHFEVRKKVNGEFKPQDPKKYVKKFLK